MFMFSLDTILIYIADNTKGHLYLNDSAFQSNVAFALIKIQILYELSFFNVSCVDQNNFDISGSCFYFENILLQTFDQLKVFNAKSQIYSSGIIFLGDETTLDSLNISNITSNVISFIYIRINHKIK